MKNTFKFVFAQMGLAFVVTGAWIMFEDKMYHEASVSLLVGVVFVALCWMLTELK